MILGFARMKYMKYCLWVSMSLDIQSHRNWEEGMDEPPKKHTNQTTFTSRGIHLDVYRDLLRCIRSVHWENPCIKPSQCHPRKKLGLWPFISWIEMNDTVDGRNPARHHVLYMQILWNMRYSQYQLVRRISEPSRVPWEWKTVNPRMYLEDF